MKVYVVQEDEEVLGVFSSREKAFEFHEAWTGSFDEWWKSIIEAYDRFRTAPDGRANYFKDLIDAGRDAGLEVYKKWTYQECVLDEMGDK